MCKYWEILSAFLIGLIRLIRQEISKTPNVPMLALLIGLIRLIGHKLSKNPNVSQKQ